MHWDDVAIACASATHGLLRAIGLSRTSAYVVMVCGQPLWWRDETGAVKKGGGFYSTRVVMARSDDEAKTRAVEAVKNAILASVCNPAEDPVAFNAEDCTRTHRIVWRQSRGFSFWGEDPD